MTATVLLIASGILAVIYLLCMTYAAPSALRSAVKTGSIALLAVVAAPVPLLAVALGLCALGDLALSRSGERAFVAGIAAFALGHLAYVVLFRSFDGDPALTNGWQTSVAVGIVAASSGLALALWSKLGPLRWPVLGYIAIITAMGISALSVPAPFAGAVIAGALLFILSDSLIATERFLIRDGAAPRWISPAIWSTYWLAQVLFCVGIVRPL
jgi:uncharacterized membrane protein YhhN